jgi:hypothetical protein
MDEREAALQQIVALARAHGLTAADIAQAIGQPTPAARDSQRRSVLVRVLGFLGGTFVFAGIAVFIAIQWDSMNSAARVVVTLGSGLAALALGLIATRDPRFEKATTPLLLVATVLEPTGILVTFEEYGTGGDWHWASLITSGVMAAQFGLIFGALRRSTPLFVMMAFAVVFAGTALDQMDVDGKVIALVLGASMLLAAIGIGRTEHRDITPLWYLAGAFAFLAGLFDLVKRSPGEMLFLGAAAGFVYLSVVVHSRTLLVASTLGILAYTGWFTGEHFADSIGWPLALIAFGIFMIGLSALAFRIDRDYVRRPAG